MSLLIFIIVVLVVLALACYAATLLPVVGAPYRQLLQFVLVIVAILVILNRVGLLR